MSIPIKFKRSAVEGKTPHSSSLDFAELAINTRDGKIYLKRSGSGATQTIWPVMVLGSQNSAISGAQTELTGTLFVSGNIELTSSATVDGVDISVFSSSAESRIVTLEANPASFWTASGETVSRLSDVLISGSLFVSSSISGTEINWDGSAETLTSFSSSAGSRITTLEGNSASFWTASGVAISRFSDVLISGSLLVSSSISGTELNWDGASETLTSFSSSAGSRITTLEGNPASFWTASGDFIRRQSDVEITGTLYVSGNIELTSSATVDGVDISEFSSSVATEVDGLQTDSASFSTRVTDEEATSSDHETRVTTLEAEPHWTASGTGISRFSDVTVSGTLFVSSSISASELNWDGASETLTSFSSSAAGRITTLEGNPASFWTASGAAISRFSDVLVSGSLLVSSSISGTELNWDGASETLTSFSSSAASRVTTLEAEPHWTASGTGISRFSDVTVSGSLFISSSISASELNWDGAAETLTSFSSSAGSRITTLEGNPASFWTASGDFIRRQSDVQITGSLRVDETGSFNRLEIAGSTVSADTGSFSVLISASGSEIFVSGNLDMSASTTVDGVDISEFSSSAEGRIVVLEGNPASFWTASGQTVSRFSDVLISGSLLVSSSISGTELNWDGASETLTSFSSSAGSRITTLEGNPTSFWTSSGASISRFSNVIITGSLILSASQQLISSSQFFVSSSGRVGIGTTEPLQRFHVRDSANLFARLETTNTNGIAGLRLVNDNYTWTVRVNSTDHFNIRDFSSGSVRFMITTGSGNIGIGTVAPRAKLDVSGSTRFGINISNEHQFTGSIQISGNIILTSSATVDGVDISEFSSSVATEIDSLEAQPHWTASGAAISRFSDVLISGSLLVSSSISGTELNWDGASETLTSFSSSAGSRITTLEGNPTSFWTASGAAISRFSDVLVSGSLLVSSSISGTELNWDGASETLTSFSSSAGSRITTLEGNPTSFWTASGAAISRFSDVLVSGSLLVSSSISGTELNWDGASETLTSFSSSTSTRITTLEATPGLWTSSGDFIRRQSDVHVSGTLFVSGNVGEGIQVGDFKLMRRVDDARYAFFQSNRASFTVLSVAPSGSGQFSAFEFFGTDFEADSTNYERISFRATSASINKIASEAAGEGIRRDFAFFADEDSISDAGDQIYLSVSGNVGISTSTPQTALHVNGTISSSEFQWSGSAENLTSFSSSTEGRITTLEGNPASFWTASGAAISRFSDVLVSGSLLVSSSISGTELNWDGAAETLTSFSSSTSTRITTLEGNPASFWTESGTGISRQSDVEVTGTLEVSGSTKLGDLLTEKHEITGALEITSSASMLFGIYNARFGDTHGAIRVGNAQFGHWDDQTVASLPLSGTVMIRNMTPPSGNAEFIFAESNAAVRFAIATSRAGVGTWNVRSMLIAGPATNSDASFEFATWGFRLAADTDNSGSDLGVQNDLEVLGKVFVGEDAEISGALGISGTLDVSNTSSFAEVNWDGASETLTSFSSSAGSRITTLEGNPASFWTASGAAISRFSDVLISGSLFVSNSISGTEISWDGGSETLTSFSSSTSTRLSTNETDITNLQTDSGSFSTRVTDEEATSSDHETRVTTLEAEPHWTASGTGISRFSDVTVSGTLFVSSSISSSELNWDGAAETLTSFSSSAAGRITTLEATPGLWTSSGDFIRRQSDVEVTGTLSAETGSFTEISASIWRGLRENLPVVLSGSFDDVTFPPIYVTDNMDFQEIRYQLETGSCYVELQISGSTGQFVYATESISTQNTSWGTIASISASTTQSDEILLRLTGSLSAEGISVNMIFLR